MPLTEAQRRAKARYEKKVKSACLKLYPTESDLVEWLSGVGNVSGYIKSLIRTDMERACDGGGGTDE